MKNIYFRLVMLLVCCVTLSSCSDDADSGKDNEIPRDIDIVGTWKLTIADGGWNGYQLMVFHPDGKFTLEEFRLEDGSYDISQGTYRRMYDIIQMTYLTENGLPYQGDDDVVIYTILSLSDNRMSLRLEDSSPGHDTDYTDEHYAVWDRVSE